MVRLSISDPAFSKKLSETKGPIQLTDAQGRILGKFLPDESEAKYPEPEDWMWKGVIDAETAKSMKTYTTAEVIAYLRSLG